MRTKLAIAIFALALLSMQVRADKRYMCLFDSWYNENGVKEENVRQMANEYQKEQCTKNKLCKCAEILTRCMFGPDHKGAFVTEEVSEDVANKCNKQFCICTTHPNYQEVMQERTDSATDKTIKPETLYNPNAEEEDKGPSIGSMGFTGAGDKNSDQFSEEEISKEKNAAIITQDRASLYILCKFGPDSKGDYSESILSMFDYEMLCKAQKSDFCTCNEDKLYQIKDGEFLLYGTVTDDKDGKDTLAIAVVGASLAVVLVAIAIILIVILFICRHRQTIKEHDDFAQRQTSVQMGQAVDGVAMGHVAPGQAGRVLEPDGRDIQNLVGSMPIADDMKQQRRGAPYGQAVFGASIDDPNAQSAVDDAVRRARQNRRSAKQNMP